MKHFQRITPADKLKMWLELCDFAFELKKAAISKDPVIAEKQAYRELAAKLKSLRKHRRITLAQMP